MLYAHSNPSPIQLEYKVTKAGTLCLEESSLPHLGHLIGCQIPHPLMIGISRVNTHAKDRFCRKEGRKVAEACLSPCPARITKVTLIPGNRITIDLQAVHLKVPTEVTFQISANIDDVGNLKNIRMYLLNLP